MGVSEIHYSLKFGRIIVNDNMPKTKKNRKFCSVLLRVQSVAISK